MDVRYLSKQRNSLALSRDGSLPQLLKLFLIAEILPTYAMARWRMTKTDIRHAVEASRAGLDPFAPVPRFAPQALRSAVRLARVVDRTLSVLPTDSRCLVQALVLSRLLSRRGIASRIVIGAHSREAFAAHAWVECAGLAVQSPAGFEKSRLLEL